MTITIAAPDTGGQTPTRSRPWLNWGPPVFAHPLFALGFRPFYLAGAASAVILLPLWLAAFAGGIDLPLSDPLAWHAHEMLFGFGAAIITGFLFTAVRNWTGGATPTGLPLAALLLLWLAGRLAPFVASAPLAATIDLAFLPLVAISIARPIAAMPLKAGGRRPWMPVLMLSGLTIANLLHHLGEEALGRALGFGLVTLLIAVIAGRVIPSFTMTGAQVTVPAAPKRDRAALTVLAAAILLDVAAQVVAVPVTLLAIANAGVALLHLARLQQWRSHRALRVPLLAILHLAYAWLPLSYALRALANLDLVAPALALHALGIGAMSGLMLGMMTRSALGHTGRALKAGPVEIVLYAAIMLAALARVCAGLHVEFQMPLLCAAGLFWEAAFGLFLLRYVPILLRPRADGRSG